MSTTKMKGTIVIISTLVYLILSVQHSISIKLTQPQRIFDYRSKLIFSHESFDRQQVAYAVCTNTSDIHIQQCQIFFQNLKILNVSHVCNVPLTDVGNSSKPRMIVLNSDNVILAFDTKKHDDDRIWTTTPHFVTIKVADCTVYDFDRYTGSIISSYSIQRRDGDRFDAVLMEVDEFCRWEYDIGKHTTLGPFDCLSYFVRRRDLDGQPINPELPFMGYIVSRTNNENWIAVNDKLIRTKFRPPLKDNEIVTSTVHNKITLCSSDNSLTTCWQYDRTGELLNTVFLTHGADLKGGTAVYNLKSGGLIVAVGLCEEGCTDNHLVPTYYVSRYNEDGRRMKMRAVRDFKCDVDLFNAALKFDENEKGNICLTMGCYGRIPEVTMNGTNLSWRLNLNITSECFDDTVLESSYIYL